MSSVGAVLVTHQSRHWIGDTLRSIASQSYRLDRVVVVDDRSTDDTIAIVRDLAPEAVVVTSVSTAHDTTTRIAQNFRQGLVACADLDVVVLGDHDDAWHPDRVDHQVSVLGADPGSIMVASDGRLVDATGRPTGGSLRANFPVPPEWSSATAAERMRIALRHSLATGGASAVRPSALVEVDIPAGWLHDRWWSLVATACEAMIVDDAHVIDYRISADQQVGLATGSQRMSAGRRAMHAAGNLSRIRSRVRDIEQGLAPRATEAVRPELQGVRLLRTLA